MVEQVVEPKRVILGDLIRNLMEQRQMTIHKLADAAGVGVGAISNLLRQGTSEAATGVHPLVLRKVAEVFDLDQVLLFQLAGYIVADEQPHPLTANGYYVGLCFDSLPSDQQKMLLGIVHSMMEAVGLPRRGERIQKLLDAVDRLREQHPRFQDHPFGIRKEVGRIVGNLTRTTTREILVRGVLERVNGSLKDPARTVSEARLGEVVNHPDAMIVLNYLLPRKEIPTGLEKLYWLLHDASTAGTRTEKLPAQYRDDIKALWTLLDEAVLDKGNNQA
jgi:transcriptional regulator with XRE-family HTH domain